MEFSETCHTEEEKESISPATKKRQEDLDLIPDDEDFNINPNFVPPSEESALEDKPKRQRHQLYSPENSEDEGKDEKQRLQNELLIHCGHRSPRRRLTLSSGAFHDKGSTVLPDARSDSTSSKVTFLWLCFAGILFVSTAVTALPTAVLVIALVNHQNTRPFTK